MRQEVTAEWLRDNYHYDPETGSFTHKKDGYNNTFRAGDPVGTLDDMGYLRTTLGKRGRQRLHRLAWLYVHGKWPDHDIDHINGNRADNHIANLRDVPRQMNLQNARNRPLGKAGIRGVTPRDRRFVAQINVSGKNHYLGRFDTPEAAHAAYIVAKRQYHEGFVE